MSSGIVQWILTKSPTPLAEIQTMTEPPPGFTDSTHSLFHLCPDFVSTDGIKPVINQIKFGLITP